MFSADSVLSEPDKLVLLFGKNSLSAKSLIHLLMTVIFDSSVALVFLSILCNYAADWTLSASQPLLLYNCFKSFVITLSDAENIWFKVEYVISFLQQMQKCLD